MGIASPGLSISLWGQPFWAAAGLSLGAPRGSVRSATIVWSADSEAITSSASTRFRARICKWKAACLNRSMPIRPALILIVAPLAAWSQSLCPSVNFVVSRTVSLKPTTYSHIDVVRQSDGSYAGFEVDDRPPYPIYSTTPHFERQFANCLPHSLPAMPSVATPANLVVAGIAIDAFRRLFCGPDLTQTVLPVFTVQGNDVTLTPLDLSQPGQVYLLLFGTGFDKATAASTVVTIHDVSVPVQYAGPQLTFAGFDQIGVLLPPSLVGSGVDAVQVTIGGKAANSVYISIK